MKLLFIGTTGYILFMMNGELKSKQTPETESNRALLAIIPGCALLALILNDHTTHCAGHPFDCLVSFLWAFSIYLEAVAIIPQLVSLWSALVRCCDCTLRRCFSSARRS